MIRWDRIDHLLSALPPLPLTGRVTQVVGLVVEARLPGVQVGDRVLLLAEARQPRSAGEGIPAEVVGFRKSTALLMPLGELEGIGMGSRVEVREQQGGQVAVGDALLGRVVDGLGRPLDDLGPPVLDGLRPLQPEPLNPLKRRAITQPLPLGVRAVDGLLTVGRGQRVAILAGAGVGKSTLLGNMARSTEAQVNVIALVGERGREVGDFLQHSLSPEARARSTVVVSTSDQPPTLRLRAAQLAMTVAEHFRERGKEVLFIMDSLTRFAMAAREIGLSVGEPSTTRGYTPSVFALLPRFLERAGSLEGAGSVTGLYTVLVEGDDPAADPIADAVRSIVDGHFVLSRKLANLGHFPAIDILESTSRVFAQVTTPRHQQAARQVRALHAEFVDKEDTIQLGLYRQGSNPFTDRAIALDRPIRAFLRQESQERSSFAETLRALVALSEKERA